MTSNVFDAFRSFSEAEGLEPDTLASASVRTRAPETC